MEINNMTDHYKSKLLMEGIWEITDYSDGINPTVDMYLMFYGCSFRIVHQLRSMQKSSVN